MRRINYGGLLGAFDKECPEPSSEYANMAALKALAAEAGTKAGPWVHPLRLACSGATAGPSLYHLMEILGRDRVLPRIEAAMAEIEGGAKA